MRLFELELKLNELREDRQERPASVSEVGDLALDVALEVRQERDDDVLLGAKVVVDRTLAYVSGQGDIVDRRTLDAVPGEEGEAGGDDPVTGFPFFAVSVEWKLRSIRNTGAGFFIFALFLSAVFDPKIRVLHTLQTDLFRRHCAPSPK